MHLAELNIAKPKYALDDQRIADFVDNLDRINTVAESMPGYVWRYTDESGNAIDTVGPWGADVIVNTSVWETPEHFENFVWNTVHKRFYNRKNEWFDAMDSHYFVMWWVEEGHQPTFEEAKERLDHLDKNGDSDFAFGWSHLPHVKLWQTQQCG